MLSTLPLNEYQFGGTLERSVHHKVNNNEPPIKPPTKPKVGNYCFRAYTTMTSDTNEIRTDFTGYANTMDIVERVDHYCELNRTDANNKCNPTRLAFIGDTDDTCDGRVLMHDKRTNLTQTFY